MSYLGHRENVQLVGGPWDGEVVSMVVDGPITFHTDPNAWKKGLLNWEEAIYTLDRLEDGRYVLRFSEYENKSGLHIGKPK